MREIGHRDLVYLGVPSVKDRAIDVKDLQVTLGVGALELVESRRLVTVIHLHFDLGEPCHRRARKVRDVKNRRRKEDPREDRRDDKRCKRCGDASGDMGQGADARHHRKGQKARQQDKHHRYEILSDYADYSHDEVAPCTLHEKEETNGSH